MNRSLMKRRTFWRHISKNSAANFLKFCILINGLMSYVNLVIIALFSGVLDKNPTP